VAVKHNFDAIYLQIVAFGQASAANDSGGILLTDPHKQVILYVCISCLYIVHEKMPHSG